MIRFLFLKGKSRIGIKEQSGDVFRDFSPSGFDESQSGKTQTVATEIQRCTYNLVSADRKMNVIDKAEISGTSKTVNC